MDDDDVALLDSPDELSTLEEVAAAFKRNVSVKLHVHLLVNYPNTFSGRNAIDTIRRVFGIKEREEALQLARKIQTAFGLFEDAKAGGPLLLQDDKYCFYKFVANLPSEVDTDLPLNDVADIFEHGVEVADRSYHFRKYKKCFIGREAVDFMIRKKLAINREEAVELGRELVSQYNLFEHVHRDHDFKDDYLFFKFVKRSDRLLCLEENPFNVSMDDSFSGSSYMESSVLTTSSRRRSSTFGSGDNVSTKDLAEAFENGVEVKTHYYHLLAYQNTFEGAEAVNFLVNTGIAKNRKDAIRQGLKLQKEINLFQHVTDDHDFQDKRLLYRFTKKTARIYKVDGEQLSLEEIAQSFESSVKVKDMTYRLQTYKQVFVASKAVDFLVNSQIADSRADAVNIGLQLQEQIDLFEHVANDHKFCDDFLFFRMKPQNKRNPKSTSNRANVLKLWNSIPPDLVEPAQTFVKGVFLSTHYFRGNKFRNTFTGTEAVNFFVNGSLAESRKEAIALGRRLHREAKLFITVAHENDFTDDYYLFRFEDAFHNSSQTSRASVWSDAGSRAQLAEEFREGVNVADRRYHLRLYRDVFVGREAVDFMMGANMAESRSEAVCLGRQLAREFNFFHHVTRDHQFNDDFLFYRFTDRSEAEESIRVSSEIDSTKLALMAEAFEDGVQCTDHKHKMRVYKNTFTGKEGVDFLMEASLAKSRREAVHVIRLFIAQFNLVDHVTMDHDYEDNELFYVFMAPYDRRKGLFFREENRASLFDSSYPARGGFWEVVKKIIMYGDSLDSMETDVEEYDVISDDVEWVQRLKEFEKKVATSLVLSSRLKMKMSNYHPLADVSRVKRWSDCFKKIDPRSQIESFFTDVAHTAGRHIQESHHDPFAVRPLLWYLPSPSAVFSVWRPTSFHAISKMMKGEAVGKGLDIKGKSAKRGRLSGFVPFLQISNNKHKKKIRTRSKDGKIRLFFKEGCRVARDNAAVHLERVAEQMHTVVQAAKKVLARDNQSDKEAYDDALEAMLLDMNDPSLTWIDDYAPKCYGLEIPERLFWEAYFERQDISRTIGSIYDTGRASQPAFQDMNFSSVRIKPTSHNVAATSNNDGPRAVIFQNAESNQPMNPFELLMAYEEHGRVLPVVSDFDCFLLGTKRVDFSEPIPSDQLKVLEWCVSSLGEVLDASKEEENWTNVWLDVLKKSKYHPTIPKFGFGDPKTNLIVESAVKRLKGSGAVRHGAESFNYYFPQDLDDQFLVVRENEDHPVPWKYLNLDELQDFLSDRIDEGFCFPLNPKWILIDGGKWRNLYDKLLESENTSVQQAMDIWFPVSSGIREQIRLIRDSHPKGFYGNEEDDDFKCCSRGRKGPFTASTYVLSARTIDQAVQLDLDYMYFD